MKRSFASSAAVVLSLVLNQSLLAAADDLIGKAMIEHSLHHYEQAKQLYMDAIDKAEAQNNTKQVALALKGMGMLSLNTNETEDAAKYYRKAVDLEAGLSDVDEDTRTQTLLSLASSYLALNRDNEARPLFLKALSISRSSNNKLNQIITLDHLGTMYRYEGNLNDANKMSKEAMDLALAQFGTNSLDTAQVMSNRAMILGLQCKYQQAEELLLKSLAASEKLNGKDGLITASINSNIAMIYLTEGKLKEAENTYLNCIATRKRANGGSDAEVPVLEGNLARVYLEEGNTSKALELGESSLGLLEALKGSTSDSLFNNLIVLGTIYSVRGDNQKALKCAQRALEMSRSYKALLLTSQAYLGQGKIIEAEKCAKDASDACEAKFGPIHPQLAKCLEQMAKVKGAQHKFQEVRELERRISQIKRSGN